MTEKQAIQAAIEAGILSNTNLIAFDFAGNYRVHDIKAGEVVFRHIVDGRLLHWIVAA